MLTPDPKKMLQNLYDEASEGCIFGVSIWGDKATNFLHRIFEETVLEHGIEPPRTSSNFLMYNQLQKIA